jgi:hypothetical protein
MPANYGIVAGSISKILETKILLTAGIQAQEVINGIYGSPFFFIQDVTPGSINNVNINEGYEILSVDLTATLTSGLDEDYYSNPVVGQSVYFDIGGTIFGDSSLGGASSQTKYTDSSGQVGHTISGEYWMNNFSFENIQAFFDGNPEGTFLPSQSGIMTIGISAS